MKFEDIYNNTELNNLVIKYSSRKFNNTVLKNIMEHEDFLQLCYIRIDKYIITYDEKRGSISTFLCTIINSLILHELRKLRTDKNNINLNVNCHSLDYINSDDETENIQSKIDSGFDINEEYYKLNNNELLNNCYDKIEKEFDKKVFYCLSKGLTLEQTSNELNKSLRTVKYSKQRLKEIFV